jgi:translation elongation factor EF-G
MWTVDREYDQPIRHMDLNRSGGSFVANLTLRVAPDLDQAGVIFACAVADEEAAPYIPFVEQGVRAFVANRAAEGRPVGHLRVTLTAITIHPVDAKSRRFVEAAEMALSRAFEVAEVELQ